MPSCPVLVLMTAILHCNNPSKEIGGDKKKKHDGNVLIRDFLTRNKKNIIIKK